MLVDGALQIARSAAISEAVVGLTVIAIGTPAPELFTTLVSTVRDDRDIALGNLFGSSVYNVVFILGLTVLVAPGGVHVPPEVVHVDLPLMTATALLCVPVFVSGRRVSRWEGALFVACYAVYLTYLLVARIALVQAVQLPESRHHMMTPAEGMDGLEPLTVHCVRINDSRH